MSKYNLILNGPKRPSLCRFWQKAFCLLLVKVYKQKRVVFSDATDNDIQYVFIDEFCGLQEEITEDTLEILAMELKVKDGFSEFDQKLRHDIFESFFQKITKSGISY